MIREIPVEDFDSLDPKKFIVVKGVKVNNLKNLSVAIPRNTLTVITGVSGSGKSSLAFDTIYAEGQRQYVESLSSYARQFLGRMEKPEVDYIKGISPAIAIEQRVNTKNPRSTVGTTTEIYDYLKLLFARIGATLSPISGKQVKRKEVHDVVAYVLGLDENTKVQVFAPLVRNEERTIQQELDLLVQKGYTRILIDSEVQYIEDLTGVQEDLKASILIDRLVVSADESFQGRLADSVQTAFFEGNGECSIEVVGGEVKIFSERFELDGITFEVPSVNFFAFNNPYGACKTCEGFGHVLGLDETKIFPDKNLSVYEGAIAPWKGEKMSEWLKPLLEHGIKFDFPIHRPIEDLTEGEYQLIWNGNEYFEGLNSFFKYLEVQTHKIQYRVMLSRYRGRTVCPDCRGTRLRKDTSYVKIGGKNIQDLLLLPVEDCLSYFDQLELNPHDAKIADKLILEVKNRLTYLTEVGLGYLTLNRLTSTLSGGEYQRIKLATSLGSSLVGSMYVLDEPSVGLHPRDTAQLITVLKRLRDLGNTVIVVEHEEDIMRAADYIIDIGPDAGAHGGELVFEGNFQKLLKTKDTHTARFLNNEEGIEVPTARRAAINFIKVVGARQHNLKNVDVKIPLNALTVVTGVSGSGKSTLIKKIVLPVLENKIGDGSKELPGVFKDISGDVNQLEAVEFIDQNPIGKSSRSNPVTYVKAYDEIRALFSSQPLAKQRVYKPAFFSFNVDGGRCEACQGEGVQHIEMQFMADIYLTCEACKGKRFKKDVLEIKYNEKSISDVLDLTIDEAIEFFAEQPKILVKLKPLQDVGLGYIKLGQSANSLSGGEAQRVKLASFLGKGGAKKHTFFVFDEPTTGLHFKDIQRLLTSINALIDQGNSVLIIEHNMEVIKTADWLIDLGPEGGAKGGELLFQGVPEDIAKCERSYTAKYLAGKL